MTNLAIKVVISAAILTLTVLPLAPQYLPIAWASINLFWLWEL